MSLTWIQAKCSYTISLTWIQAKCSYTEIRYLVVLCNRFSTGQTHLTILSFSKILDYIRLQKFNT